MLFYFIHDVDLDDVPYVTIVPEEVAVQVPTSDIIAGPMSFEDARDKARELNNEV